MDSDSSLIKPNSRLRKSIAAFRKFGSDAQGTTAIEYALLATLIAIACLGGISATGISVTKLYADWTETVMDSLKT